MKFVELHWDIRTKQWVERKWESGKYIETRYDHFSSVPDSYAKADELERMTEKAHRVYLQSEEEYRKMKAEATASEARQSAWEMSARLIPFTSIQNEQKRIPKKKKKPVVWTQEELDFMKYMKSDSPQTVIRKGKRRRRNYI